MNKQYTIGLDIGTNSVGWAVLTDDYELIRRKMKIAGNTDKKYMKKNFWGVRLFDEGETAADRRFKRTNRRRITRRHYRLQYLQAFFTEDMKQLDANFFHRLGESFLVPDEKSNSRYPIFSTLDEEINYHKEFPTIYHLRKKLADSSEKADLRLVYLAIAHMIKYRGHFLIEGSLSTENSSVQEVFKEFIQVYNQTFTLQSDGTYINYVDENVDVGLTFNEKTSRAKRAENVLKLFQNEAKNGTFAQFIKMIVGNQGNFKKSFEGLEEDTKLQFSKEEFEELLEELLAKVGDEYADVFVTAKKVYDAVALSDILTVTDHQTNAQLSSNMIHRYHEHQGDLKKLKQFIIEKAPDYYAAMFKDKTADGYAGYIQSVKQTSQEKFYHFTKKVIGDIEGAEYFLEKIDQENFLRKQRTFDNGVIPHQIHLEELKSILKHQSEHYPFLKENQAKIISLLTFRIPYYVGPLAKGSSENAWLIRKSDEAIRPWNLEEVVDTGKSAAQFIEKMTNFDTYLSKEKVLPKHSMLYEKYMVFNELTKVNYTDERGRVCNFSSVEKKKMFDDLFKEKRKVSKSDLEKFLRDEYNIETNEINGIESHFNAGYGTYHDLIKCGFTKEVLDNPENIEMLEDIIKLLTIFEDRKMIRAQLLVYEERLDKKLLKKLERRHYTGWGRLSRKLINGIRDKESHKTILDYLINDDETDRNRNRNLMQLINDEELSFKEIIEQARPQIADNDLQTIVGGITGSPAIKKGILQSLKIVEELVDIMGYLPTNIVVEMARENQTTTKGRNSSKPRYKSLEKGIDAFGSDILKKYPTENKALQNDRLYLYYLQNGRDMYTGEELVIENLSNYDVDHIIPQSFITDNSLDNRVLVSSKENRGKSDDVPSIEIVKKREKFWEKLYRSGLISKQKFDNLTKAKSGGLTEHDKAGFIKRQLVETRQITKHVANVLHQLYNRADDGDGNQDQKVRIVTLKSSLTSEFRKSFDIYKVREINDYHHGHDAYLNGVVANVLLKVYPQLEPEFVYGEYRKFNLYKENKATAKKQLYTNIMKFFTKEKIIDDDTKEILWDRTCIATVKKVMAYRQMNIVKKTEVQKGGFSKESVNPKGESDKLIPRKNGWDTAKYGGFDSPIVAYSIIISYEKGKARKAVKSIVGITIMEREEFEKDEVAFLIKKGYQNPIVKIKLPKYTLYEFENGRRRLLASAGEAQKGNQMVLDEHLVTLLYHAKHYGDIKGDSKKYVEDHKATFAEILQVVKSFSEKNTIADKNLETIIELYKQNKDSDCAEIADSFVNLMRFNAMGAPADFKFFGKTIPRKRYTSINDLLKATIINQSITGLYETRRKLED